MDVLREQLVLAGLRSQQAHIWEPFEAVCSCGFSPPVEGGYHQVDRHEMAEIVNAILEELSHFLTPAD